MLAKNRILTGTTHHYINPPPTYSVVRSYLKTLENHGQTRVQRDLLRQRLLSESAYQCSAKIGLLINGTFFESFPYNADVIFFLAWFVMIYYMS